VTGSDTDALWLFDSLHHIDFTEEVLIQEAIAVSQVTSGAISFSELKNMDIRSYELVLKECIEISKKIPVSEDQNVYEEE